MVVSTVVVLRTAAWKVSIGCVNLNSCYGLRVWYSQVALVTAMSLYESEKKIPW